ncbi:hypothetical protein G9A89_004686 [Geosiphon pyriformis]|nr:hypothetical protein G9A89_004686 [Geosiphon pyriformis]
MLDKHHIAENELFKFLQEQRSEPESKILLGMLYILGIGTKVNPTLGRAHLEEIAEEKHPIGMYCAATQQTVSYYDRDKQKEVLNWIKKSAEAGFAPAQSRLAVYYYGLYDWTQSLSLTKDFSRAFYWHERAARQKHPHSAIELADGYSKGTLLCNGKKDLRRAFLLWRIGAKGINFCIFYCEKSIAICYKEGFGTMKDMHQAFRIYHNAVKKFPETFASYNTEIFLHDTFN